MPAFGGEDILASPQEARRLHKWCACFDLKKVEETTGLFLQLYQIRREISPLAWRKASWKF